VCVLGFSLSYIQLPPAAIVALADVVRTSTTLEDLEYHFIHNFCFDNVTICLV